MNAPPLNPGLFNLDQDHLWVMHCAEGPVPRATVRAVDEFLHKELWPWALRWQEDFLGLPDQVRTLSADLVGASPSDISLTANTSTGLVSLAHSFPWHPGDEVIAPLGEFPSNVWPWKALYQRGVIFTEMPLWKGQLCGKDAWASLPPTADDDPESRLVNFFTTRTQVLAVSWVRFQDGLKLDLARLGEMCRRHSVYLVVDGIQGAGAAMPDLRYADAFVAGGHKGLLAPQGLGFLWTRPEFREQLIPCGTWLSVEDGTDFQRPSTDFQRSWLEDGRRLEPGGPNLLGATALLESLRMIQAAGVLAIETHVRELQGFLLDRMEQRGLWLTEVARLRGLLAKDRLGPILCFHHEGRGPEAMQEILKRGFEKGVYASVREGYLRIAFHGWHSEGDAERIVEWLASVDL